MQLKDGQSIAADLVVDASGGNSRVNKWLEQIGHPTPPSMVVDAGLQYTCRMYEMTGDPKSSTNLIMIMDHPEINRMAVRLPIEHNKWQVRVSDARVANLVMLLVWSQWPLCKAASACDDLISDACMAWSSMALDFVSADFAAVCFAAQAWMFSNSMPVMLHHLQRHGQEQVQHQGEFNSCMAITSTI